MKKRLLAIAAITATVVGAIVLILAMLPVRPGVTRANVNRLVIGMSKDEVEAIFRVARTKDFHLNEPLWSLPQIHCDGPLTDMRVIRTTLSQGWKGEDGTALVVYAENTGKLDSTLMYLESATWEARPTSLYQKLQQHLPWLPG